jgi:hypothetical protein
VPQRCFLAPGNAATRQRGNAASCINYRRPLTLTPPTTDAHPPPAHGCSHGQPDASFKYVTRGYGGTGAAAPGGGAGKGGAGKGGAAARGTATATAGAGRGQGQGPTGPGQGRGGGTFEAEYRLGGAAYGNPQRAGSACVPPEAHTKAGPRYAAHLSATEGRTASAEAMKMGYLKYPQTHLESPVAGAVNGAHNARRHAQEERERGDAAKAERARRKLLQGTGPTEKVASHLTQPLPPTTDPLHPPPNLRRCAPSRQQRTEARPGGRAPNMNLG